MGGAHVFPGGRVDDADRAVADERWCDGLHHATAQLSDLPPLEAVAFHVAAVRELFEEAGVLLARDATGRFASLTEDRYKRHRADVHSGKSSLRAVVERECLRVALDSLIVFAHWVTPPVDTRRFDTRFFMTRVPPDQVPVHDDKETTHSVWITPADAIAASQQRAIDLPPPTWTTLRELESFQSVDETLAWARTRALARREPLFFEQDGRKMLLLPGDPLHPEQPAEPAARETRFVLVNGRWCAE